MLVPLRKTLHRGGTLLLIEQDTDQEIWARVGIGRAATGTWGDGIFDSWHRANISGDCNDGSQVKTRSARLLLRKLCAIRQRSCTQAIAAIRKKLVFASRFFCVQPMRSRFANQPFMGLPNGWAAAAQCCCVWKHCE